MEKIDANIKSEKLMELPNLLNFEKCTTLSEVEEQFFQLSKEIMLNNIISNNERTKHYLISNLELFIDHHTAGIKDPYIYNYSEQQDSGTWLVHKEKHLPSKTLVSITCGKKNVYLASLKVNSLIDISRFINDNIKITPSDLKEKINRYDRPADAFRMLLFGEKIIKKRGESWTDIELQKINEIKKEASIIDSSLPFSIQPRNVDESNYKFEINSLKRKIKKTDSNRSKKNFKSDYIYTQLDRSIASEYKFRSELTLLKIIK